MNYQDIDKRKTAFVFELDNVLYPEKDYLFQIYYLFANMLEYVELINAQEAIDILKNAFIAEGKGMAFERLVEKIPVAEKYSDKFDSLLLTAKLPLKLLLYKNMLTFLQEVVIDRKKLFIVTNGNVQQQVNKIKQTEWHGLEKYLTCYLAEETAPKPEPDVIELLMKEHNLQRRDIMMIENSETDRLCAQAVGIDYINMENFL